LKAEAKAKAFQMKYPDFTNMSVWKKAIELLLKIYEITKHFPAEEKFGLTSDMRRAVNSISHNFAEGFGRFEPRDKTRFYQVSRGSRYELMSQSFASFKLGYIEKKCFGRNNPENNRNSKRVNIINNFFRKGSR